MSTSRYHPLFVTLHWLVGVLVVAALVVGGAVLSSLPNDATKVTVLAGHMSVGLTVGALMLLRLVLRFTLSRPDPAVTGKPALDLLGGLVHFLMYIGVFGMVITGLWLAQASGALAIVFGGAAGTLPEDFHAFPQKEGHEVFAGLLGALIALHVLAALYHQFGLQDRLMARMWFGRRD